MASFIGFLLTQTAFEDSSSSADNQLMFKTEQSPMGGMFSVYFVLSNLSNCWFDSLVWRIICQPLNHGTNIYKFLSYLFIP